MPGKKPGAQFIMAPTKLFKIGLNSRDRDVFLAIASHGGKNGTGIRPSYRRICELTGLGRSSVAESIRRLALARVVTIESGCTGRSNSYRVNAPGVWQPVPTADGSTSPNGGWVQSPRRTGGSPHGGLQPYPLNHIQEPEGANAWSEPGEARERVAQIVKSITGGKSL